MNAEAAVPLLNLIHQLLIDSNPKATNTTILLVHLVTIHKSLSDLDHLLCAGYVNPVLTLGVLIIQTGTYSSEPGAPAWTTAAKDYQYASR